MNWIITDKADLKGTAYIEVYPDKFVNTHWNDSSIFFQEGHFEYFVPIIRRNYPGYDPYGFQSINHNIWENILIDFKELCWRSVSYDTFKNSFGSLGINSHIK